MKTTIATLTGCILFVVFLYFALIQYNSIPLLSYSVCSTPLEYKLGSVDPRFSLSTSEALDNIEEGGKIWSDSAGKKLYTYSPDADLTINFEYDARQALNTKINQLNNEVDQKEQTLKQQIEQYKTDVKAFDARLNEFENTVQKYNKEGGAPEGVYEDLIKQQNQLKSDSDALNARARELNLSTNNYNSDVAILNQDVNQFNTAIKEKPEEGVYDPNTNTISIYFADQHDELVHTLAHELGHALGMDHVNNSNAIMYPNTTNLLVLTDDDKAKLAYTCRNQSAFLHEAYVLNRWIYEKTKNFLPSSAK